VAAEPTNIEFIHWYFVNNCAYCSQGCTFTSNSLHIVHLLMGIITDTYGVTCIRNRNPQRSLTFRAVHNNIGAYSTCPPAEIGPPMCHVQVHATSAIAILQNRGQSSSQVTSAGIGHWLTPVWQPPGAAMKYINCVLLLKFGTQTCYSCAFRYEDQLWNLLSDSFKMLGCRRRIYIDFCRLEEVLISIYIHFFRPLLCWSTFNWMQVLFRDTITQWIYVAPHYKM